MNSWGKLIVAAFACLAFFLLPALSHLDLPSHSDCASEHACHDEAPASDSSVPHDCGCPCHHAFTALITVNVPLAVAFVTISFPQPVAEQGPDGVGVSIERPPSVS